MMPNGHHRSGELPLPKSEDLRNELPNSQSDAKRSYTNSKGLYSDSSCRMNKSYYPLYIKVSTNQIQIPSIPLIAKYIMDPSDPPYGTMLIPKKYKLVKYIM